MIAAPNGWSRAIKKAGSEIEKDRSESARRRLEYWRRFLSNLRLTDADIVLPKPNSLGNLRFNLQGRDLWITVYAASSLGRIGVFLRGNSEFHSILAKKRRAIDAQLREPAGWNKDGESWNIAVSREADPAKIADWDSQHKWLATRLDRFVRVFKPYVGSTSRRMAAHC